MIGFCYVAFEAGIPLAATFEFDCDNIDFAMPMGATGLRIDVNTIYFFAMN